MVEPLAIDTQIERDAENATRRRPIMVQAME